MLKCLLIALALPACIIGEESPPDPNGAFQRPSPDLSDAQIAYHAYQVLLDRQPDPGGFDGAVGFLQDGNAPDALFAGMLASPEFANRPELHDPAGYVTRLYRVLLERDPDAGGLTGWVATLAPDRSNWYQAFAGIAGSPEYAAIRRPLAGIHYPIPIDPRVDLTDADVVDHMYRVLLGRTPDDGGQRLHVRFARANGRDADFREFVKSAELLGNPALRDKRGFVARLYSVVLGRAASQAEIDAWASSLGEVDSSGSAPNWLETYRAFVASAEYKGGHCQSSYFTYDEPIARSSPLLDDVVEGRARIQGVNEARIMDDGPTLQDGSKLAFFSMNGKRYAFSRFATSDPTGPGGIRMNVRIYELTSSEPPRMVQVTGDLFQRSDYAQFAHWMLDPQLAIDNSVCPRRYLLTMECDGALCMSYSTTPLVAASWSPPVQVVAGTQAPYRSASTGRTVFDHERAFLSWTEVDNGNVNGGGDEGNEHATTSAIALPFGVYDLPRFSVADFGHPTVLDAEHDVRCTSSWDCNNKDGQDWKKEGAHFYLLYNGGNYYNCDRREQNLWGISVARAGEATVPYTERAAPILGDQANTCDLSYPMVHAQDGRLVVTYGSQEPTRPVPRWAEIVWR